MKRAAVAIPPRDPDAVEREPEHHRRAREFVGCRAAQGHGDVLPRQVADVAPNNKAQFGEEG
jgi:hypothetical protein